MAKITIIQALKKLWNATTELMAGKQGTLTAGTNIDITNNTIKANGYRYNTNNGAFAEGDSTIAYGKYSHVEGANSVTGYEGIKPDSNNLELPSNTGDDNGGYAHAEGSATLAIGNAAHAEGRKTFASGNTSHAEGNSSQANGVNSHAEGRFTETSCNAEHAQGSYNLSHHINDNFDSNAGNTLHSIGIGTDDDARKNAVEVMQNGDAYLLGVGNYDGVHIKGQSGAPTGLRTLQEVVSGLRTDLENGLNECQKTVYPYARFDDATGEVTGDYPDGGEYYNEDESYFKVNYIGAYSGNGGRVVCVRPWRITELITNNNMGVPIELLLVDPMYNSEDEWYANREYIIRVVCDGADGNISVPSSIRWATPQIHRDLADLLGINIDDYAYMPPLRDGHTYDIHILNGVAWWIETPNA